MSEPNARAGVANSELVLFDGSEKSLEPRHHHVAINLFAVLPPCPWCTPAVFAFNRKATKFNTLLPRVVHFPYICIQGTAVLTTTTPDLSFVCTSLYASFSCGNIQLLFCSNLIFIPEESYFAKRWSSINLPPGSPPCRMGKSSKVVTHARNSIWCQVYTPHT